MATLRGSPSVPRALGTVAEWPCLAWQLRWSLGQGGVWRGAAKAARASFASAPSDNDATETAFQGVRRGSQGPSGRTATTRSAGSALHKYGRDLTREAQEGRLDPLIGRQDVIQRVLRVLMRKSKNNAVLVGEAGVGKTAVAEGIAQLLAGPSAPVGFAGKRMISLDVGSLVAGTQFRGAFEERLQAVLMEIRAARGSVLLFVDEIHMLVNAGRTDGSMDAANLLKPALARGELHCLGATTPDEYRRHIESDPAFARRFQPVHIEEPSVDETLLWLRGLRRRYERHHRVEMLDGALEAAARHAKRYLPHRRLPDSAIDLLDEAAASARLRGQAEGAVEWASDDLRADTPPDMLGYMVWSTKADLDRTAVPIDAMTQQDGGWHKQQLQDAEDMPPLMHGSVWGGEVHYSSARPPRPCPHCAMPVKWQPPVVVQLKCPACNFRFLNVAPEQLMLGSSVVSPPSSGTATRVAIADFPRPMADIHGEQMLEYGSAAQQAAMPPPVIDPPEVVGSSEGGEGAVGGQDAKQKEGDDEAGRSGVPGEYQAEVDKKCGSVGPSEGGRTDMCADEGGAASGRHMRVTEDDVLQVVSYITGMPLGELTEHEHAQLTGLAESLQQQVVGQEEAIRRVVATVQMGRLGLQPEGRPRGSYLFAGPPGVGKSMLAEQLAARVFGEAAGAVVRLNGSDFAERASISRLLGPPPGYVGFGQGGELTEPVRRRPHSLVIVDNVDAAHPDVQELLAQMLENGRLTDSTGRMADFANSIVILTTRSSAFNQPPATDSPSGERAGEAGLSPAVDAMPSAASAGAAMSGGGPNAERRRGVLPALIDRVDDVVSFNTLKQAHIREIVRMKVGEAQQAAQKAGVRVEVSEEVESALTSASSGSTNGAQSVARLVRQHVTAPLAQAVLKHSGTHPKKSEQHDSDEARMQAFVQLDDLHGSGQAVCTTKVTITAV